MFYCGHLHYNGHFFRNRPNYSQKSLHRGHLYPLYIADTFSRTRRKFYLYIAGTKQQFRFLSRVKVLVKKKISHFIHLFTLSFTLFSIFSVCIFTQVTALLSSKNLCSTVIFSPSPAPRFTI